MGHRSSRPYVSGTAIRVAVTFLLVLTAFADLAAPSPPVARSASFPHDLGGQEPSAIAMDPDGRVAVAVVNVDPAATALNPTACNGPSSGHCDIYAFDLDAATPLWAGAHGSGLQNDYRSTAVSAGQVAAVIGPSSKVSEHTIVVGGPSATIASWTKSSREPQWEATVVGPVGTAPGLRVDAVAVAPDASLFFAGANNAETGILGLFVPAPGSVQSSWSLDIRDVLGGPVNPHVRSLTYLPNGQKLLVGTTHGLIVINRTLDGPVTKPTDPPVLLRGLSIAAIVPTSDSWYVIVGTNDPVTGENGTVHLVDPGACTSSGCDNVVLFSAPIEGSVQTVATMAHAHWFGAGSSKGNVSIFSYSGDKGRLRSSIMLPGPVTALRMSDDGWVTVAATPDAVYGLAWSRAAPVWELAPAEAGVEAPIRDVLLSKYGERMVVSGKTKVTSLAQLFAVSTELDRTSVTGPPGESRSFRLLVENTGSVSDTHYLSVERPAGWSGEGETGKWALPGDGNSFNFTLQPPPEAEPGEYQVALVVRSMWKPARGAASGGTNDAVLARSTVRFTVSPVTDQVRLVTEATDVRVDRGVENQIEFSMINIGNADVWVDLFATQNGERGAEWHIWFDNERVLAKPGVKVSNKMRVVTDTAAPDGDMNAIVVIARSVGKELHSMRFTAHVNPDYLLSMAPVDGKLTITATPGNSTEVGIMVENKGTSNDTVRLTSEFEPRSVASHWSVGFSQSTLTLESGRGQTVGLTLESTVPDPAPALLRVKADSTGGASAYIEYEVKVAAPDANGSADPPAPGGFDAEGPGTLGSGKNDSGETDVGQDDPATDAAGADGGVEDDEIDSGGDLTNVTDDMTDQQNPSDDVTSNATGLDAPGDGQTVEDVADVESEDGSDAGARDSGGNGDTGPDGDAEEQHETPGPHLMWLIGAVAMAILSRRPRKVE